MFGGAMKDGFSRFVTSGLRSRWVDVLALVFFLTASVLALAHYRDHGVNVDDGIHVEQGQRLLRYYKSGFTDYSPSLESRYGAGFNLISAAIGDVFGLGRYHALQLFAALLGILAWAGSWALGRTLFGPSGGLAALALIVVTPSFYANFGNPKDLPLATGYIWSLYCIARVLQGLPAVSWSLWIKTGVVFGLAMSVRIGGLLVVCYMCMALFLYFVSRVAVQRDAESAYQIAFYYLRRLLVVVAVAWAIMCALWPYAMRDPLHRPFYALSGMSSFSLHKAPFRYWGEWITSDQIPWTYLPSYFSLQTPEVVVIFAFVGAGLGLWGLRRVLSNQRGLSTSIALFVLGFAIFFPPVYATFKHSSLYSGMRHFLFILPPLCVLAAGGLVAVVRRLSMWRRRVGLVVAAVASLMILEQGAMFVRVHPHQFGYFNRFIGGPAGAFPQFSMSSSASYKEALLVLQRHLWESERANYLNSEYRLAGCNFSGKMLSGVLPRNFVAMGKKKADFWVSNTRRDCHMRYPESPIVWERDLLGAPLLVIRDRRSYKRERRRR